MESFVISILGAWNGEQAGEARETNQHREWTRAYWRAMEPFATHWVYANFLNDEGDGRIRAAYGFNYERLMSLKNSYDPTNFFALNQDMKPTI